MDNRSIEFRLQTLEKQRGEILCIYKTPGSDKGPVKDWRRSLGMFDNHPEMKQIDEAGLQIRRQDRESSRE